VRLRGYLLCINNDDYPVALELRKVYQSIPDPGAVTDGVVRVIDGSGEDYLFPQELFVMIDLPPAAQHVFAQASNSGFSDGGANVRARRDLTLTCSGA
jgi:hypothetical protein